MTRTIKPKIIIEDGGDFHQWFTTGCDDSHWNVEDNRRIVNALWNSQAGVRRQLFQTRATRKGTVITFPDNDMMREVAAQLEG